MKRSIDIKLIRVYLWVAFGYVFIGLFSTVHSYPGNVWHALFNNLWGVVYVMVVNFILFEYTIPFVLRKRRFIIYNILLGILFAFIHMMLYSYGGYAWRLLGIELNIYTPLKVFSSLDHALQNQMGYSVGSVFFTGVVRHIYKYNKLKQAE